LPLPLLKAKMDSIAWPVARCSRSPPTQARNATSHFRRLAGHTLLHETAEAGVYVLAAQGLAFSFKARAMMFKVLRDWMQRYFSDEEAVVLAVLLFLALPWC
jgi:hypothetical protein